MSTGLAPEIEAQTPTRRGLFLAPMKPPDHPNPSGDRMIARQFLSLLHRIGVKIEIPSVLRTYCAKPEALPAILARAAGEQERILCEARRRPACERADFVFTYHNYYKAPDLIGPAIARALAIPYIIAESSRAPDRAVGPWSQGHSLSEQASDLASLILTPTARDQVMLEALRPAHQRIVRLRPFLDLAEWPAREKSRKAGTTSPVRLLTVAMMRPGVKVQSYALLAAALQDLASHNWTLDIVGDGEARAAIADMFKPFGDKVAFHGAIEDKRALGAFYGGADLFVWPGVGEAIGMVYLEAQAHRLPCLAYGYGGVADAVADGVSGYLVPSGETRQFSVRLADLVQNSSQREHLGMQARLHIEQFHTLEAATIVLGEAFRSIGLTLPGQTTVGPAGRTQENG